MNESKQKASICENKLASFKARYKLNELNTSKESAAAMRISEYTLRLSRSTGRLLGVKAPEHEYFGRAVRYRAAVLMNYLEQFNNQEAA